MRALPAISQRLVSRQQPLLPGQHWATAKRVRNTIATMAATKYDCVVKGSPEKQALGDCPFTQRVLITLNNKGIDYSMTYVDFARKPDWLQQASGGKVPVLRQAEQGMVMPDSDVITEFLEKQFPEPSMKSEAPAELGNKFFPSFVSFVKTAAGTPEEAEARGKVEAELQAISDFVSQPGHGPLIGGARIDTKDASLAPKLYHACIALKAIKGYSVTDKFPAIKSYMDALSKMPAWTQSLPTGGEQVVVEGWKAKVAADFTHK